MRTNTRRFFKPPSFASRFVSLTGIKLLAFFVLTLTYNANCHSDLVSFDSSVWDHSDGNGPSTGWTDGQFSGSTPIGSDQLVITTSQVGSAVYTADHFRRIDESFFTGFAFQLDPGTTINTTSFDNYARYDFSFSFPVQLDSFTLTDVDRLAGAWYDTIAAEGFATQVPGAVSSGFAANYLFEPTTNLETFNQFGLLGARPTAGSGNVLNTPENDVTFNFTDPIQSFSIYHWNQNAADSGALTQTIGIRGNEFEISLFGSTAVPEPNATCLLVALAGMAAFHRRRKF